MKTNKTQADDLKAYLISKGWKEAHQISPWRWKQPGVPALWTFQDAVENQQARDRDEDRKI